MPRRQSSGPMLYRHRIVVVVVVGVEVEVEEAAKAAANTKQRSIASLPCDGRRRMIML